MSLRKRWIVPPKFTTADVADLLGISTNFIIDEIKDGRLKANVVPRGHRTVYRIEYDDLKAYCERHWPRVRVPIHKPQPGPARSPN